MTASVAQRHDPRAWTPVHLWIVGVLALLWNGMGAGAVALFFFSYARRQAFRGVLT